MIAFDKETGAEVWAAHVGRDSYGSIQTLELHRTTYLAILSDEGLHLYEPTTGKEILRHEWKHNGYRALQPQLVEQDKVLIPTGLGSGTRLIQVANLEGKLQANTVWTSRRLRPDFNDCVQHEGHVYGFDDGIFACIKLADGEKAWKGGRYGKGQVLLLPDSDALIVQRKPARSCCWRQVQTLIRSWVRFLR